MPRSLRSIVLLLLPLLFAGCAGLFKNYGTFVPDDATADMFESYQVNPAYNYYFSGTDAVPNAILGVDKKYTLKSSLWKPVDLTPARLKSWINLMLNEGQTLPPAGLAVMDGAGNQVGVWFSYYATTFVRMLPENSLEVAVPDTSKLYYHLEPFDLQDW
ncbi:MAG: hypothetical protein AB1921_02935 [Thermodesulfobacteriota bacterium]